jgi:hypothetical protein
VQGLAEDAILGDFDVLPEVAHVDALTGYRVLGRF